jgi:hypothetical protein
VHCIVMIVSLVLIIVGIAKGQRLAKKKSLNFKIKSA